MRWNRRAKVDRPEYPKLVAIAVTSEEVQPLLRQLLESDPDAAIVDGGARGTYVRVHNSTAEDAARHYGDSRNFPLA